MNKIRRRPVSVASDGPARRPRAAGAILSREARRLLAGLAAPGAYALADPTAPESLILACAGRPGEACGRGTQTGAPAAPAVSLGGGRHPAAAGAALLAAGLAEREGARGQRIAASEAGRARLRRETWAGEHAFAAQHLDLVVNGERDGVPASLHDASESPLAWMARRRGRDGAPLLDPAAFEAGERLRRDLTQAALLPRTGPDWGAPRVDGGGPRDPAAGSDARLAAKLRVDRALSAVGGDLAGLLIDLCGFLKGLERIEVERGWPARSAKVVARIALDRLAAHYGLGRAAVGPERTALRLWRTDP